MRGNYVNKRRPVCTPAGSKGGGRPAAAAMPAKEVVNAGEKGTSRAADRMGTRHTTNRWHLRLPTCCCGCGVRHVLHGLALRPQAVQEVAPTLSLAQL